MRKLDKMVKRLIIAGGGHIGARLAQALEERFKVKVIERNVATSRRLSEQLSRAIVLQGDAADENLLRQENIENMDVFCAVTNDDEANILSAMLAKRMGARKVMALINRVSYVDLVESSGIIDVAISPQQATIGSLLTHVRRGDVVKVHSCVGAPPKRSRRWPTATTKPRRSWGGVWTRSNCRRAPPSAPWPAATRSSSATTTP